ncbi:MAG TPA: hypothetical protein VJ829_03390 [Candidatus Binatia bacterium]|nr:hypothetical protein [Candidatus Binatia bacterium]
MTGMHTSLGRTSSCLALLAALLVPVGAGAQMGGDFTGVVGVKIKGTLVKDEATANDVGWGGISLGFTGDNAGKIRWLGVVHATTFDGNTFAAKSAVFRAHMTPTLTIAGPPDLAKKLFDLPDGTRVHIEGAIERRSHTILLDLVQPLPASSSG